MRIIIAVYESYRPTDANTNIALIFAKELLRRGDCVCITGLTEYKEAKPIETVAGIQYYRKYYEKQNSFNKLQTWTSKIPLLNHLIISLISRARIRAEIRMNTKFFNTVGKMEKTDGIIAFSNPFHLATAVALTKSCGTKCLYQIDPYAQSSVIIKKSRKIHERLREEIKAYKKLDCIFMTHLQMSKMNKKYYEKYRAKMTEMEYPLILPPAELQTPFPCSENSINCVFAGYFYEDIRNPQFFLDVVSTTNSSEIIFHIIGGGMDDLLAQYKNKLGNRLVLHGTVSIEESQAYMNKADILVNIGNTVNDQVPSKLFNYICTGLPIINFRKLEDCPTKYYIEKYPLCLDILEDQDKVKETAKAIEDFCLQNKKKRVDFSKIETLYKSNTVTGSVDIYESEMMKKR